MAYIVPSELPQACSDCAFCACKFSFPFWATYRGDLCGKQGFYCLLDTQNPRRVMVVDFNDKTRKMGWCPLKEVVRCKECEHWRDGVAGCTDHVKCCEIGFYMVDENGYCVFGERKTDGNTAL